MIELSSTSLGRMFGEFLEVIHLRQIVYIVSELPAITEDYLLEERW